MYTNQTDLRYTSPNLRQTSPNTQGQAPNTSKLTIDNSSPSSGAGGAGASCRLYFLDLSRLSVRVAAGKERIPVKSIMVLKLRKACL